MRELQQILSAGQRSGEVVLGTVVDVMGSAYRRPGARVLIAEDGHRVGMISGGCLDKDVARHAFAWTEAGPRAVLYDTRGDALNPQGRYGSGCDGVVKLLLERLPGPTLDPLALIEGAWSEGSALAVGTVYEGSGELAALVGRRAHLDRAGAAVGDLPDPLVEALRPHLQEAAGWRRPRSITLRTASGDLTALVESIAPPVELLVLGAGDDARPLVQMAAAMGYHVTVADKWPALATGARFPAAARVLCAPVEELLPAAAPGPHTAVVVMTHNFDDDARLLPALLSTPAPWIGLMGPRRRTMKLMRQMLDAGDLPSPDALARVQTPVGLDLGADAPEEVALSILSGLVAARNGAAGGLLKASDGGSIHADHQREAVRLDATPVEVAS